MPEIIFEIYINQPNMQFHAADMLVKWKKKFNSTIYTSFQSGENWGYVQNLIFKIPLGTTNKRFSFICDC